MRNVRRVAAVVLGLAFCLSLTACQSKPQAGEIGVVRNGGPFDNKNIRQIVPNGAGNTWVGWGSETHYYPVNTQQRFFRMATCFDDKGAYICKGADALAPDPGRATSTGAGSFRRIDLDTSR